MKSSKKVFIIVNILFFTLCSLYVSAQQYGMQSGSMQISMPQVNQLQIEISGPLTWQDQAGSGFLLCNLLPGDYWVKIYLPSKRGATYLVNQIVSVQPGRRTNIKLGYGNLVNVSYTVDPNSIILYTVAAVPPIPPSTPGHPGHTGHPTHTPTPPPPPAHPTPAPHPVYAMNDHDFNNLRNEVQRTSFSQDKLNLLHTASDYNYFTSNQLGQLLKLFSMDNDKLKCAQIIVPRVIDYENLYLQANQFTFSSTKNEYLELIRR